MAVFHILEWAVPTPFGLPDFWVLINCIVCCVGFVLADVYVLTLMHEEGQRKPIKAVKDQARQPYRLPKEINNMFSKSLAKSKASASKKSDSSGNPAPANARSNWDALAAGHTKKMKRA